MTVEPHDKRMTEKPAADAAAAEDVEISRQLVA